MIRLFDPPRAGIATDSHISSFIAADLAGKANVGETSRFCYRVSCGVQIVPTTVRITSDRTRASGTAPGGASMTVVRLNTAAAALTKAGGSLIAAAMIHSATIRIARRRRAIAVWAVVRV